MSSENPSLEKPTWALALCWQYDKYCSSILIYVLMMSAQEFCVRSSGELGKLVEVGIGFHGFLHGKNHYLVWMHFKRIESLIHCRCFWSLPEMKYLARIADISYIPPEVADLRIKKSKSSAMFDRKFHWAVTHLRNTAVCLLLNTCQFWLRIFAASSCHRMNLQTMCWGHVRMKKSVRKSVFVENLVSQRRQD